MSNVAEELAEKLKNIESNSISKSQVESMIAELKHDESKTKDMATPEDFIKHLQDCDDPNCSINKAAKDMQKRGFLKGYALNDKLHGVTTKRVE